ncbi:hypothetical protein [Paenibacillus illinoisensis]|uniref:hypothetical protein n=1 Tax=Paenibacillus illinoisensis TaxID=59845 RepID=UPI00301D83F3
MGRPRTAGSTASYRDELPRRQPITAFNEHEDRQNARNRVVNGFEARKTEYTLTM